MSERATPSWLTFTIQHVENNPEYHFDGLDISIQFEVRDASDEDGNTSEYQYWFIATNGHRIQYHGENWAWDENGPHTITWRNLRRTLKREVLLDCLDDLEHLKPVAIWFDHEDSPGNPVEINPKDYSIDISKYLYKEAASD